MAVLFGKAHDNDVNQEDSVNECLNCFVIQLTSDSMVIWTWLLFSRTDFQWTSFAQNLWVGWWAPETSPHFGFWSLQPWGPATLRTSASLVQTCTDHISVVYEKVIWQMSCMLSINLAQNPLVPKVRYRVSHCMQLNLNLCSCLCPKSSY